MNYNCFLKDLTQRVQERVADGMTVEVRPAVKNNGVVLDSMMIRRPDDMICPNIYLNPLYERYLDGVGMDQVVENILATYRCATPALDVDPDDLLNQGILRSQAVYRLVNYERNARLLEEIPHKQFLDLALIYYAMVHTDELGDGAIMVRNEMLEQYDMTIEELDEAAKENTVRLLPADFLRITDLLREFGEKSGANSYSEIALEEESDISPLFVLTNRQRQFGAYYMTDTDLLSGISRKLNSDLYLLPSSVHECMIVPAGMWEEADSLSFMVKEINSTQVSEDEYLADTVYRFCCREKTVVIAAA